MPALRAGRRHGIPVVYEVRALWEDAAASHGSGGERGLRYQATRLVETRALRRADAVTTICEGLRADVIARGVAERQDHRHPQCRGPQYLSRTGYSRPRPDDRPGALRQDSSSASLARSIPMRAWTCCCARCPISRSDDRTSPFSWSAAGRKRGNCAPSPASSALGDECRFCRTGAARGDAALLRGGRCSGLPAACRCGLTELVTPLKPLEAMAQERIVVASRCGRPP